MNTVLITGADGFIGAHLTRLLSDKNVRVFAISFPSSPVVSRIKDFPNVTVINADLGELSDGQIEKIRLQCGEIDVLYHLAWVNASGSNRSNLVSQLVNCEILKNVLRLYEALHCKKMVATGTIYEEIMSDIAKADSFVPNAYYLYTKSYIRELLKQYRIQKNKQVLWIRFCHPIGRYNKTDQIISSTILKLHNGETPVFSSASTYFDVIAVEDLAFGLYLAGKKELKEFCYFIGGGKPRQLKKYLLDIHTILGIDSEMIFKEQKNELPLPLPLLDCSPFSIETGYYAKRDYKDAVQEVSKWIKTLSE